MTDQEKLIADIVRLNNQDCDRLRLIRDLCAVIETMCGNFVKDPNRIEAYTQAKAIK
jgi:hypothetical protein